MGRGPCTFKTADATRLAKAVRKAGVEIARVELHKDGTLVIIAGNNAPVDGAARQVNEWDEIDGADKAQAR
jgi:hypothetical protein